ncbi:MAG: Hcp family type VI secretion system effector [Gemmataceae bacterium]
MAIFMKMEGIDGNSTSAGHEGWVIVDSLQFGIGRGIPSPQGSEADREASTPSVSEIVVTKTMDKASSKLFEGALCGEGVKCEIHLCKTDAGQPEPYTKYDLEDVLISGYSMSSGGDRPTESLSLNFTKITYTYIPMKDKNETGDPYPCGYDLAKQSPI